jgi:hypothetical protein
MLQRVQSIFLAVVAISMLLCLFVPFWDKKDDKLQQTVSLNYWKLQHKKQQTVISETKAYHVAGLAVSAAIVAIVSLLGYKNRLRQMKLNMLNSLLIAGTLISAVLLTMQGGELFNPLEKGDLKIGAFLPVIAILCNSVANRFIRKDERLVQSSNRIR